MTESTGATDPAGAPRATRVGLTGGIASGKSTVGRLMAEAGCTVTDADRLVGELHQRGEAGSTKVEELFGPEYLSEDGSTNKDKLAQLVFGDDEARKRLEAALHPLVGQRFAQLVMSSSGLVVFEATLLVETGGYRNFDALVVVVADAELRVQRAVERGLDEDQARARLAAQATDEQRLEVADFVIRNEGSLDELTNATHETVAALKKRFL